MLYNFTTLAHVVSVPTLNFVTLRLPLVRVGFTWRFAPRCERRGKVKAEQENNVISKLYNYGGLALDLLPQGVSKGGTSTGLNFATMGRAYLGA